MQKNVIIKYGFKKRGEESCYTFYFSFALVRAQEGASAPCSSSICGVWKLALIVAGTFNLLAAACMDGKKPGIETIFQLQYILRGLMGSLHNNPILDDYKSQSARVLAMPWTRAHQDDSNVFACFKSSSLHCVAWGLSRYIRYLQ